MMNILAQNPFHHTFLPAAPAGRPRPNMNDMAAERSHRQRMNAPG
jgi:hypothetical protein